MGESPCHSRSWRHPESGRNRIINWKPTQTNVMKKRVFHPAAAKLSGRTREMTGLALRDFLRCGIAGWCLEILFTSVEAWMRGDPKLTGRTDRLIHVPYLWRRRLLPLIVKWCDRWLSGLPGFEKQMQIKCPWQLWSFAMVLSAWYLFTQGNTLQEPFLWAKASVHGIIPVPDHIGGVIRLAFIPFWFGTGLLFWKPVYP